MASLSLSQVTMQLMFITVRRKVGSIMMMNPCPRFPKVWCWLREDKRMAIYSSICTSEYKNYSPLPNESIVIYMLLKNTANGKGCRNKFIISIESKFYPKLFLLFSLVSVFPNQLYNFNIVQLFKRYLTSYTSYYTFSTSVYINAPNLIFPTNSCNTSTPSLVYIGTFL